MAIWPRTLIVKTPSGILAIIRHNDTRNGRTIAHLLFNGDLSWASTESGQPEKSCVKLNSSTYSNRVYNATAIKIFGYQSIS